MKCTSCFTMSIPDIEVLGGACPVCSAQSLKMQCIEDHVCSCTFEIQPGVHYCPKCGKPICLCGSHNVEVISRITGYLSSLEGWNSAKQQELKDRNRVTV